jgi:hypothetical protein
MKINEIIIESDLDEGWKEKLAAAGLAASIGLGAAGGAQARVLPGQDPDINRLTGKPVAAQQVQKDTDKKDVKQGFSKEYLQKVINDELPRPLISKEKAKELLFQMELDPVSPDEAGKIILKKRSLESTDIRLKIKESATAGATSAANIATVVSPHVAIGKDRGNVSYTGKPGQSGTKAPSVPKAKQPKKKDGTAVNALDIKANVFGEGNFVKR